MKEQVVSFETAKLAKEKGFDWECWYYYPNMTNKTNINHVCDPTNWNKSAISISATTQSLLKKWLRENHNIEVEVYRTGTFNEDNPDERLYGCQGENWDGETEEEFDLFNVYDYEYEKAFEKGLYLALESIKINEEENESKNNK